MTFPQLNVPYISLAYEVECVLACLKLCLTIECIRLLLFLNDDHLVTEQNGLKNPCVNVINVLDSST